VLHVHIGPSPLALGLLIPATLDAGMSVGVIGRPGDKSPLVYVFSGSGPDGFADLHRVDWFEGPNVFGDLPNDLRGRIESDEPLLLTCTLRKAIAERRALIEEILESRPDHAETILLACENAPDPVYSEIVTKFTGRAGFQCLQTVVNRMCIGRKSDSKGRRVVSAHPLGEWLIAEPAADSAFLEALSQVDEVSVVSDIEARHDRKLWMVNGAHQALAVMAWAAGLAELRIPGKLGEEPSDDLRRAAEDGRVIGRLSHIHTSMNAALRSKYPELEDSLDYGLEHVQAYGEHPDSIRRVLEAFKRGDLGPFIKTLDLRLAVPARICFEMGIPVSPYSLIFDLFEDLVGDLDAFMDTKRVRRDPSLVTREADHFAVSQYRIMLTGWMDEAEANERLKRFTKALVASRPW